VFAPAERERDGTSGGNWNSTMGDHDDAADYAGLPARANFQKQRPKRPEGAGVPYRRRSNFSLFPSFNDCAMEPGIPLAARDHPIVRHAFGDAFLL